MDHTLSHSASARQPRPRRQRSKRDPYDGLRPWSAITHGAGADHCFPCPPSKAMAWDFCDQPNPPSEAV